MMPGTSLLARFMLIHIAPLRFLPVYKSTGTALLQVASSLIDGNSCDSIPGTLSLPGTLVLFFRASFVSHSQALSP
jgi:hypothetical protein